MLETEGVAHVWLLLLETEGVSNERRLGPEAEHTTRPLASNDVLHPRPLVQLERESNEATV